MPPHAVSAWKTAVLAFYPQSAHYWVIARGLTFLTSQWLQSANVFWTKQNRNWIQARTLSSVREWGQEAFEQGLHQALTCCGQMKCNTQYSKKIVTFLNWVFFGSVVGQAGCNTYILWNSVTWCRNNFLRGGSSSCWSAKQTCRTFSGKKCFWGWSSLTACLCLRYFLTNVQGGKLSSARNSVMGCNA